MTYDRSETLEVFTSALSDTTAFQAADHQAMIHALVSVMLDFSDDPFGPHSYPLFYRSICFLSDLILYTLNNSEWPFTQFQQEQLLYNLSKYYSREMYTPEKRILQYLIGSTNISSQSTYLLIYPFHVFRLPCISSA